MGLPASQRRVLETIEQALRRSDPRLASLFAIFTRLNRDEQMPRAEELRARAVRIASWIQRRLAAPVRWLAAPVRWLAAPVRWLAAPARSRLRAALCFPAALGLMASALLIGTAFPTGTKCTAASRTPGTTLLYTRARGTRSGLCVPLIANPVFGH